jgi:outer membrane lipoprotein-sorting protein
MRRKIIIPIVLVAAVIALLVGVLVVPARGSAGTTTKKVAVKSVLALSRIQLFAKVAATLPATKAVHGQFEWTNNILESSFKLPAQAPAILQKLWASGTGKFWYQDGKFRLQAGSGTDQVTVVENGKSVWVYDATSNTATQYAIPAERGHGMGPRMSAKPSPGANGLSKSGMGFNMGNLGDLSKLMSAVNLNVGLEPVAGQDAYILTIKPTATNTTLDSIKVAFDATTFVPLSVDIMANGSGGASTTALHAAMTSVDYNAVAASQFDFTLPTGAKIVHGNVKAHLKKAGMHKGMGEPMMNGKGKGQLKAMMKSLSVAKAQAKVGFPLVSVPTPTTALPFDGANVVAHKNPGPFAILRYGNGFGTIVLAEGNVNAAQQKQVLDALGATNLGTAATVGGNQGTEVTTPLVNAFIWTTNGVFHVAAGPVQKAALETFVTNLN